MDCTLPNSNEKYTGPVGPLQAIGHSAALLSLVDPPSEVGLYGHIPFCFHKCHYCDFYSIVDDDDRQAAFARRWVDELTALADAAPPIRTIFIGGGTPTLLRSDLWKQFLHSLRTRLDLSHLTEFTVEANPETVTAELLNVLVAGGVNRISIGCQSFNPTHLKTLERWHDPANVARAVELARAAGIDNINLDLIFAVPGQNLDDWAADLHTALTLGPTHMSCYGLTYEPNTALTRKLQLGRIDRADENLEAAMFNHTIDTLIAAGFEHYEISNFAKPTRRCQHNMTYWLNGDWLALGPSASGHLRGYRWKNIPHLGQYLASTGGCPITDLERLDADASLGEQLMLRLRLIEGADRDWLQPLLSLKRLDAIERFASEGLLEFTPTHLRLTRRGVMVADPIIAELL